MIKFSCALYGMWESLCQLPGTVY